MQIGAVRTTSHDGVVVGQARISWDEADRPPLDAWIERPEGASTRPVPVEAFVATAAVLAELHGERTLSVADPVDPALVANLEVALATLRGWFGPAAPALRWDTTPRLPEPAVRSTAFLMTGGIDSSALLVDNHARFPAGHPGRITTGIVVYGLDPSTAGDLRQPDDFLVRLAAATGIDLVPVATNLRAVDPDWQVWEHRSQMAILTGAAHGTGPIAGHLLVAASDSLTGLTPYGTHPQLDQRFGSSELAVHHEIVHLVRDERVALVVSSPAAMASLQVCNQDRAAWLPGGLNCGRCEKCIRTLVSLRAAGVRDAPTFPRPPIAAGEVDALHFHPELLVNWTAPAALERQGEDELAASVRRLPRRLRVEHVLRRARWHGRRVVTRIRPGPAGSAGSG